MKYYVKPLVIAKVSKFDFSQIANQTKKFLKKLYLLYVFKGLHVLTLHFACTLKIEKVENLSRNKKKYLSGSFIVYLPKLKAWLLKKHCGGVCTPLNDVRLLLIALDFAPHFITHSRWVPKLLSFPLQPPYMNLKKGQKIKT